MKKLILAALLFLAPTSQAHVFRAWDGYWYGNVCRHGVYYQFVPYQLINTQCFMPSWNGWGMISWE